MWDEAASDMPGTPFAQPAWVLSWWEGFGAGELLLAVLRHGGEVAGILPVVTRRRTLRAPTNSETPLFEPVAVDEEAASQLAVELLRRAPSRLVLAPVDPSSTIIRGLRAGTAGAGYRQVERTELRSPYLTITGTWAAYESALPAGRRQNLRRRLRRLEERHGPVRLEVLDGSEHLSAALEDGLRLEASGWKSGRGTAILARPAAARFYRRLAVEAAASGWLRLAFLCAGDRRVAFDYGLEHRGVHYLLKTGYEDDLRPFGPGMLLRAAMVRRAHELGQSSYELLGNDDPWKRDWSTGVRERLSLSAFPPSRTSTVAWAAEAYGRPVARRVLQATVRRPR
jgi:CelD/BcsL family acetyltransferase involved in cellulose biosynthesis